MIKDNELNGQGFVTALPTASGANCPPPSAADDLFSNAQEPEILVLHEMGDALSYSAAACYDASRKGFKDTPVPKALVKKGNERFDKDLMVVSNKYGFIIIGVQGGLLILRHTDLKSLFVGSETENQDFGEHFFVSFTTRIEVKLLAIQHSEEILAVCSERVSTYSTIELFKMEDLRSQSSFRIFRVLYGVKSLQWCPPISLSRYIMIGNGFDQIMIVDTSKPVPELYRRWRNYYAAAWSPDGLRIAALKHNHGDADVLDILDVNENSILKSIDFRKEPNRLMYSYSDGYVVEALRRDLAAIAWCTETTALVVFFESWKREKNGHVRSWNYCTVVRMNEDAAPREMKDYQLCEPEREDAFRLYSVRFDMAEAEIAAKHALSQTAVDSKDKKEEVEEQGRLFFLGSSSSNKTMTLDLTSMLIISLIGDPEHVASFNFKTSGGQHAGMGLLRLPTGFDREDMHSEEGTNECCLVLHISNKGRLHAHPLRSDTDPSCGNRWLLKDAEGKLKQQVEPRYHPKADKESLMWSERNERLQKAQREQEDKLKHGRQEKLRQAMEAIKREQDRWTKIRQEARQERGKENMLREVWKRSGNQQRYASKVVVNSIGEKIGRNVEPKTRRQLQSTAKGFEEARDNSKKLGHQRGADAIIINSGPTAKETGSTAFTSTIQGQQLQAKDTRQPSNYIGTAKQTTIQNLSVVELRKTNMDLKGKCTTLEKKLIAVEKELYKTEKAKEDKEKENLKLHEEIKTLKKKLSVLRQRREYPGKIDRARVDSAYSLRKNPETTTKINERGGSTKVVIKKTEVAEDLDS